MKLFKAGKFRSGDKANTLDLFLTSNPDIYSNPILDFPLGNSGHCLITLQHSFASHQDRSSSSQKVFHYCKAGWDSLRDFFAVYPWYSDYSNDPYSFATFITNTIQLGMDLFIPSSYRPGKKSSPKWFNSQCAKAVKHKITALNNGNFTKLRIQELYLYKLATYAPKPSIMPNLFVNRINNKIASCQTGSRSFWSLAKVVSQSFCHSSFQPLKNNSGSSSCTPSSKANLFSSTFASNLHDQESQPTLYPRSTFTMFPIKFSKRKVRKVLLQLNTSKSRGPDGIPAIVLKSCSPELAPVLDRLFQLSYNLGIIPGI